MKIKGKGPFSKEEVKEMIDDAVFEALTIQAMRLHDEVFKMGGMDQDDFAYQYCNDFGPCERKLAKREGIKVPPKKK